MKKLTILSILFFTSLFPGSSYGAILDKNKIQENHKKTATAKKRDKTPIIKLGYRKLPQQQLVEKRKRLITIAAQNWEQIANLNFKFLPANSSETPDYFIDVYAVESSLANRESRGGHGSVDFSNKVISLNMPEGTSLSELYQIPLHEFGHVLGLMHEHQHPDRPFNFDSEFLLSKCQLGSPAVCRRSIEFNNVMVFDSEKYQLVEYDQNSIMHYTVSKPLIFEDLRMPQPLRLSLQDKLALSKAYPGRTNENEILQQHAFENQQIQAKISGKCILEMMPRSARYQYIYPDGTPGWFLDKTIDGVYMSAKLDARCSN